MRQPINNRILQHGLTLIEFGISLIVVGIITGIVFSILNIGNNNKAENLTYERMDRIKKALAVYAVSTGRLPCPADPAGDIATGQPELFGWEWGVTATTVLGGRPQPAAAQTCRSWAATPAIGAPATDARNVGIVPFQTLGLQATDVIDGWGKYMTYAVSPVFAQINDDTAAGAESGDVNLKCLDGHWHDGNDNVNSLKAKFCCAKDGDLGAFNTGTDIIVLGSRGGFQDWLWPRIGNPPNDVADNELYNNLRSDVGGGYDPVDPSLPGGQASRYVTEDRNTPIKTVAYVLVSHGINGLGAYLADGTRNRFGANSPNVAEIQNGAENTLNGVDRIFREGIRNIGPAGGNYYDDILVWRTQEGVLADTGNSSCAMP